MGDLGDKQSAQSVKLVGSSTSGVETSHVAVEDSSILVKIGDSSQIDAFGRLRVSQNTIINSDHFSDDAHTFNWPTRVSGGGTVTHVKARALKIHNVGTASGAEATSQSRRYFQYIPGQSMVILFTATFAAPKTNVLQRIGFFDTDDGIFVEVNGSDVGLVIRSSVSGSIVDTRIPQSSWNNDKFDGTGESGVTLDFTKAQLFWIDYEWLGYGRIRFGIIIDGKVVYAHEQSNLNQLTSPYMQRGSLPVRCQIINSGVSASPTDLLLGCAAVLVEGDSTIGKITATATNGVVPVSVGAASLAPILAIRLKSTFNKSEIDPRTVEIFLNSNTDVYFEVIANATITGGSWVSNSSIAEKNVTIASYSGGTVIAAGYTNKNRESALDVSKTSFRLSTDINGNADSLLVVSRTLSGNSGMFVVLSYKEIF